MMIIKGAEPLSLHTQPGESRTRALISPRQPNIRFNARDATLQRQTSPRRKAGAAWPAASFAACDCQLLPLHYLSQPHASSEASRLNTPEGGAAGAGAGGGVPVSAWSPTGWLDDSLSPPCPLSSSSFSSPTKHEGSSLGLGFRV